MKKTALVAGVITLALILAGLVEWVDAAWVGAALAALYRVQPIRDPALASRAQIINNSVVGTILLASLGVGFYLHGWAKPSAYRASIDAIHAELEASDKIGDRARAAAQFAVVTGLLQQLGDNPSTNTAGPVRACMLAASHLATGLAEVSDGGRWTARDRYKAASSGCV